MDNFVVAGDASDPNFAKAERLANLLMASLPDMKITIHNIHPSEWSSWMKTTCAHFGFHHFYSPMIYTGTGVLIGGSEDFQELCEHNYGIGCDIVKMSHLQLMAEENLKVANEAKLQTQVNEYLYRWKRKVHKLRAYGGKIENFLEVILAYKRNAKNNHQPLTNLQALIEAAMPSDPTVKQVTPDEAFYKRACTTLKQTTMYDVSHLPMPQGAREPSKRRETIAEATGRLPSPQKSRAESPVLRTSDLGTDHNPEMDSILNLSHTGAQALVELRRELEGLIFKLHIAADKFHGFRANALAAFQKLPRPKNAYSMLNENKNMCSILLDDLTESKEVVVRLEILKTMEKRKLLSQLETLESFQEHSIPSWLLTEAKRVHAAHVLQAMWRGFKDRRRVEELELQAYEQSLEDWRKMREKRALKYNLKEALAENEAPAGEAAP